ncbi:BgTH12-03301 [Blumeria graminis f. sp. triticale]|uniref:Bgt-3151 n=3 Tax=Blumeria graminis TaxID=34373 RepID=A0A061HG69_BLUGR|nr:hypothetical protein BGT96224_3151 [Blumeria graminis f. sp. tritici 96224]CAD6503642.1 BgTH12-03301 [Blumeria graminis f. sp. triticale]VDB89819.1 Bgt-3151 [Blumeria graminis f. sp. tritici]
MADIASSSIVAIPAVVEETLQRLSSKSSVIATLAIERESLTVLASSGQTSVFNLPDSTTATPAATSPSTTGAQGIENFANMIGNYVNNTSKFICDMDEEDGLRLLRVRTKKLEFVIVPDSKYLFIVAHEVPA